VRAAGFGRRCLLGVVVLAAVVGPSGCGGGSNDSDVDPAALLDSALRHPVPTAQSQIDFKLDTEGVQQLEAGPVEVGLDGPYIGAEGTKPPSFDWNFDVTAGGLTVNGRLVSTAGNAFVQFLGSTYEAGAAAVANVSAARSEIRPRRWLTDPEYAGDEDVDGVMTHHIEASLDSAALAADLGGVVDRFADSEADIWIGADDQIIRQLTLSADFQITPSRVDSVGGLTGGDFSLDLLENDVGEPQRVNAPRGPYKPISELLAKLPPIPGLSGSAPGG